VLTRQSRFAYPYGGVRVAGNLPTDHTFTGQIEDDSTGLQFFNARYYSGSLGRFISADTIVPNLANPQSLNRFSYVRGNPMKYTDPTGHRECGDETDCSDGRYKERPINWRALAARFGVSIDERFGDDEARYITLGVIQAGRAFAAATNAQDSESEAFKAVYGSMTFGLCDGATADTTCSDLGWTKSSSLILIKQFYSSGTYTDYLERSVHLVLHELGHAFNALMEDLIGTTDAPYNQLFLIQANDPTFPNREGNDSLNFGFAGPRYNWQQSASSSYTEEFPDMFLGWSYSRWEEDGDGLTVDGQARADWMNQRMKDWVNIAASR